MGGELLGNNAGKRIRHFVLSSTHLYCWDADVYSWEHSGATCRYITQLEYEIDIIMHSFKEMYITLIYEPLLL